MIVKIRTKDFRIDPDSHVDLRGRPTRITPAYNSDSEYQRILANHVQRLSVEQRIHYASNQYALLIIFQALDAAGKDGSIRHVMSGVNPQGCDVVSFKEPSAEEMDHDFLWRCARHLPERGRIGVFNRSYYEDVLVVRVHPELLQSQPIPVKLAGSKDFWEKRYRSIVDFEGHLNRSGTRIVKIFLHMSKEEQRHRFLSRIDEPDKNWKFSIADAKERTFWSEYTTAYEDCIGETSSHHAPWHVVPADDKENARLILSQIVLDAMEDLKLEYPRVTDERHKELEAIRAQLMGEAD